METKRFAKILSLVLLAALLVAGFVGILERRFAEGGLYPYYASFRSDPMGTSVFYESLERLGKIRVERNLTDLNTVGGLDGDTAILLLGYPRDGFDSLRAPDDSPVMKAVEEGARLVLTVNPELVPEVYRPRLSETEEDWLDRRRLLREERARQESEDKDKGTPSESPRKEGKEGTAAGKEEETDPTGKGGKKEKEKVKDKEEEELEKQMEESLGPLLTAKLAFDFAVPGEFERPEGGWRVSTGESVLPEGLPEDLPSWRSQYRFETSDPAWKPVALVGEEPVVIERKFGKGTVVLASDSYFVSNEGLHFGPAPGFLLWMLGGKSRVIFDETIHGTVETGGAMKLIRRYRAHGVFFGLMIFLALWIWRSSTTLVPGNEDFDRGQVAAGGAVFGEDSGSGFIRLLRRSISPANLLEQCIETWKSSQASLPPPVTLARLSDILARHREDPKRVGIVDSYARIAALLRKRNAEPVDKAPKRHE